MRFFGPMCSDTSSHTRSTLAAISISRCQAVKKHLDVLEGAGLVSAHREGRQLLYRLEPAGLEESAAWLQQAAARWERSLSALKVAAERPVPE